MALRNELEIASKRSKTKENKQNKRSCRTPERLAPSMMPVAIGKMIACTPREPGTASIASKIVSTNQHPISTGT